VEGGDYRGGWGGGGMSSESQTRGKKRKFNEKEGTREWDLVTVTITGTKNQTEAEPPFQDALMARKEKDWERREECLRGLRKRTRALSISLETSGLPELDADAGGEKAWGSVRGAQTRKEGGLKGGWGKKIVAIIQRGVWGG